MPRTKKIENETVQTQENKQTQELSVADRFTLSVVNSWKDVAKGLEVTEKEKGLIAGYFIKLDEQLRNSKQNYTWKNVRMKELAVTLAHTAKLGLDMTIPGMLSFIPFRHGDTGTIDLVPVKGKTAYEYLAKRFGIDPPKYGIVELVYKNDKFSLIKRDATHDHDDYIFEIQNPFDRGEVIGAFGALIYDDPTKNKVMSKSYKELLSYRPARYDDTFWKGENLLKMLEKTMAKQLYNSVALDPEKINQYRDSFDRMDAAEIEYAAGEAKEEIAENLGTGEYVDIDFEPVVEAESETKQTETVIEEQKEEDLL